MNNPGIPSGPMATDPNLGATGATAIDISRSRGIDSIDGMSPEMLIEWASQQLKELDGDILALRGTLEEGKRKAEQYKHATAELEGLKNKNMDMNQRAAHFRRMAKDTDDGYLRELFNGVAKSYEEGKPWGKKGVDAQVQKLQAFMDEFTNSAEISMLKMQSKVQKRTHALNFVSNVIRAIDEANKNAIGNIR